MTHDIDVPKLADSYKKLVLCFGVALLLELASWTLRPSASLLPGLALLVGILALSIAMAFYGYRTADALGFDVPWLWAVGLFIPCVGVVVLLMLSARATRKCRENGIPVGLLGPRV